ncbi:MAG TPA: AAA family ATPase [Candidatus Limnocylindrales bacterium]|nr:AAA family ATPase [Candidatus Limnocylindrales bacterium]
MRCPQCAFENPPGFRFCGRCGRAMAQTCPACGADVPEGFRFCGACGHALSEPVAERAAPASGTASSTERRRVTVVCVDLVGFSSLAEQMDPEPLNALMTETLRELAGEVERREGSVENFAGDALVAIFGAPQAHEDDPERAVAAAVAIRDAIGRRSRGTAAPLQVRVGVNSGLVVAGATGDGRQTGVLGDAVNIAARLQQAAGPGDVLISAAVWRRVRERYEAQPVGRLEVKGREQPVEAYRIEGGRTPGARRQAPFVGRREELALLDILWSSVVKGNTHLVSLAGEPGVGKSRLMGQFARRDGALDIRISCDSERAFGPFLDLVQGILGRRPADMEELRQEVAGLGVDAETGQLLGALLGLAGAPPVVRMADEQQKRQVFAGVWQFLLAAPQGRPALIVFDDVHWADRSSLELLGFLLERLSGTPIMIVLTFRPGFDQVERTALRASHTAIRLEPMKREESVAVARGFLGVAALPADLERIIATRAEGNPFFIEELLQALLELGSLAVVDGTAVLAKVDVEIPDTVQGTILARVDRLSAAERGLLQQLAVIGRHFSTDLVQAVTGDPQAGTALDGLARAQLLVSAGPEQWSFKHALIQEVTYETLLLRQRRELHAKVAAALEAKVADDPDSLETLANHYARAEVSEKARRYSLAAGDLAAERMGFNDAMGRYETALRLWGPGDEEGRLTLLEKLGYTSLLGGDVARSRSALIEAESGWEALGNPQRAGSALSFLGRTYWATGEIDRATDALQRSIQTLGPAGPSPELARAYTWASAQQMLVGDAALGADLARKGLAIAEALNLDGMRANLLNTLGVSEAFLGHDTALDRLREARDLAERSGDAEAIGRIYVNLPDTLCKFGQFEEGVLLSRRGREVARKLGSPTFEWFIGANEATMLIELGRFDEAEALVREGLEAHHAELGVPGQVNAGMVYADCLIRQGRYAQARTLIDETLPLARRIGGAEFLTPALVIDASLDEALGNLASARQTLNEAIDIVLATTSVTHFTPTLAPAARLLPAERVRPIIERVRPVSGNPLVTAAVAEAEAWLSRDPAAFRRAAEMYAALKAVYEEAHCRLEAGDLERARELITRFGLEKGPPGMRLKALSPAPTGG